MSVRGAPPALLLLLALASCTGDDAPTGTVVGSTSVEIDTRIGTLRTGEAAIGDYLTDLYLADVGALGKPADAMLLNGGAIRGGTFDPTTHAPLSPSSRIGALYPAGPLTDLELAGWYPFVDDTVVVTLGGAALKSALERSASVLPPDIRQDEGGAFLQVAGMSYTIDCAGQPQELDATHSSIVTEGARVVRLEVAGQVLLDAAAGIDKLAASQVRAVLTSFLVSGKDGHIGFTQGTEVDVIPLSTFDFGKQLIEDVRATSPIAPRKDGRITILGSCGQAQ
jgi:5'-nucleotidase/UDP-sugar diphosphatase